jgi:hypothetical protein
LRYPKVNVVVSLFTRARDEGDGHAVIVVEVLEETFCTASKFTFSNLGGELIPRRRGSTCILCALTRDISDARKSEMEARERCMLAMREREAMQRGPFRS